MLIYFSDIDPVVAASHVPNGLVNKLIVEVYQMQHAALWYHFPMASRAPGYHAHPFTLWIANSKWAWWWVTEFARALACVEAPRRFNNGLNKAWPRIQAMNVPTRWKYWTQEETPLCPLPKAAGNDEATTHEERVIGFRKYFCLTKNQDKWQFLWEPRALRPEWMPTRNAAQDEIVERFRKRLKL